MEPGSIALFVGARTLVRSGDTEFPFRQDSDFWYLTGFDQPDPAAVQPAARSGQHTGIPILPPLGKLFAFARRAARLAVGAIAVRVTRLMTKVL